MFDYQRLNYVANTEQELSSTFTQIFKLSKETYQNLSRFSVTLVDDDQLANFFVLDSLEGSATNDLYKKVISLRSSLTCVVTEQNVRVVSDLKRLNQNDRTVKLLQTGHRSSYTSPLIYDGKTIGVLFINADTESYFDCQKLQRDCAFISQVVNGLILKHCERQHHLRSALAIALNIGHARDPETKEHLIRMGKYSELLARLLADTHPIDNRFIHLIAHYAPFHDIGKYKIPDDVLFSDKRFSSDDRKIMSKHTIYGVEIIDEVLCYIDKDWVTGSDIGLLKNIIRHHHERYDGSGSPDNLSGTNIPLESRIVTLADVFDALLSKRAYKEAWSMEGVIAYIKENSGLLFDPECVDLLLDNLDQFVAIRDKNRDAIGG